MNRRGPDRVVQVVTGDGEARVAQVLVSAEGSAGEGVLERMVSQPGGPGPVEQVTHFAASPMPFPSYPIGFPFLPDREVWVTEFPEGQGLPGARWPCADDIGEVVSELVRQSLAAEWELGSSGAAPQAIALPDSWQAVHMTKGDSDRMIVGAGVGEGGIVQLLDRAGRL